MTGELLQTVLMDEGMKEFSIKEITCWKFLITFKNSEEKNSFDKNRVKSWLHDIREVEDEDLRIKRKLVVELRGLPCTAWTKINLMELTKELGDSGWGINEEIGNRKLQNPKSGGILSLWMVEEFDSVNAEWKENWVVFIGDFNMVRFHKDRVNSLRRGRDMESFNKWIQRSNLQEIQVEKANFTWIGPNGKKIKLDRVLVNSEWFSKAEWSLKVLPIKKLGP
ncbi:hypothetical protein POM88_021827 [Heracleum sosnowskyi]|uniref:DUF4283 domain-containing protein n=1 Tax=Heracleum sosnowskyi TaxID=360622 RepID=A0AAD8MT59_9APIA|nr:hypothetical protein POM88_021827 [Heracleum sosnowskyi]